MPDPKTAAPAEGSKGGAHLWCRRDLNSLAELGVDRVQLTDLVEGSSLRLAPL